jgi:tetratricopeptide (TPR) repeat protein
LNNSAWDIAKPSGVQPDPTLAAIAVDLAKAAISASKETEPTGIFRKTLGVALYRAGDWPAAIAALEDSVKRLGDERYGYNGFFLAMAYWRLGERGRALMLYDRSVAWTERQAGSLNPWAGIPDRADAELAAFRAEAEALLDTSLPRPDFRAALGDFSAPDCYNAGLALGARGQWRRAIDELRRSIAGGRGALDAAGQVDWYSKAWLFAATLDLEVGDRDGYERLRRRMAECFAGSESPVELERTAKACLLVPAGSPEEARRLRAAAARAVELGGRADWFRPWSPLALCLAEYRSGDDDAAVKTAVDCLETRPAPVIAIPCLAVRAMAHARLGLSELAEADLAEAGRILARLQASSPPEADLIEKLIARQLLREAEAVVRFDPIFPADPFAEAK